MKKDLLHVTTKRINTGIENDEGWTEFKYVDVAYSFVPALNLFREKYFDLSALNFSIWFDTMYEDKATGNTFPVLVIANCLVLNIPVSVDETTSYKGTKQTSSRVMNFHPVLVTGMEIWPKNSADHDDMYPVLKGKRLNFKEVSKRIHNAMFKISEIDDLYIGRTISKNYKEPIVFTFETDYIFLQQVKEIKERLNQILLKLYKTIKEGESRGKIYREGEEATHYGIGDRVQNVPEYLSGLYKGIE